MKTCSRGHTRESGPRCKVCLSAWKRNEYQQKRDTIRARNRQYLYGITPEKFRDLLVSQDGKCAICGAENPRYVDHDHSTESVRGLLCSPCNVGLGMFKDRTDILKQAILYLEDKAVPLMVPRHANKD